jgi:pantoate--beta-alanine ligase
VSDAAPLIDLVIAELEREPLANVEYAKLCNAETLEEVQQITAPAVLALAVRIGKARLIDNRVLQH